MKKSDYLQKLDKAQNPYYYWILENEEPILSKSDLEDDFLVFLMLSSAIYFSFTYFCFFLFLVQVL